MQLLCQVLKQGACNTGEQLGHLLLCAAGPITSVTYENKFSN